MDPKGPQRQSKAREWIHAHTVFIVSSMVLLYVLQMTAEYYLLRTLSRTLKRTLVDFAQI